MSSGSCHRSTKSGWRESSAHAIARDFARRDKRVHRHRHPRQRLRDKSWRCRQFAARKVRPLQVAARWLGRQLHVTRSAPVSARAQYFAGKSKRIEDQPWRPSVSIPAGIPRVLEPRLRSFGVLISLMTTSPCTKAKSRADTVSDELELNSTELYDVVRFYVDRSFYGAAIHECTIRALQIGHIPCVIPRLKSRVDG